MAAAEPSVASGSTRGAFVRRAFAQLTIWGGFAAFMIWIGVRAIGLYSGMVLIAVWVCGGLWIASESLRTIVLRRRWLDAGGALLALRIVGAVAVLAALIQILLFFVLTATLDLGLVALPNGADYRPASAFAYWFNSAMPLGLWAAGWISIQALGRYRQGEIARLKAEAARSALELDALRARLNPHFVFNALNNLRALINEDRERARELVTRLSNTLRHALEHGARRDSVALAEELAVVDDYLAIEQVHFENRLRIERAIEPAACDARLPPMLLQLLVENAIKHGIARTPGGGVVRIGAALERGVLRIDVESPGRLDDVQSRDGHGVGLSYLRSRLAPGARFALVPLEGRVRASLEIPQ